MSLPESTAVLLTSKPGILATYGLCSGCMCPVNIHVSNFDEDQHSNACMEVLDVHSDNKKMIHLLLVDTLSACKERNIAFREAQDGVRYQY
jgi:hypothetical protein